MEKWILHTKRADFYKIAQEQNIDPVIARIIRNRDIETDSDIHRFLHGTLEDMHSPFLMAGMKEACVVISDAIEKKKKIRVIGDYDIDGVCATYILVRGLTQPGADVDYAIPHRMKDGYGLSDGLVNEAKADGIELIVTCDNGIAAFLQIELANSLGMEVIVTDHHEIPYEEKDNIKRYIVPNAGCVIDPKLATCPYPFKEICGAVVAWKLVMALFEYSNQEDILFDELLQFAAFATVGDVMPLRDENRLIVKYGLKAIENTDNIGMRALLMATGLYDKKLNSSHLGFALGPCVNASGRLDTAANVLELFLCQNGDEAMSAAIRLKELNDSRKDMTIRQTEEAVKQIEENGYKNHQVMVLFLPECHESLAGIIAGRVREKYGKPAFVLTDSEDGLKGSGRSIEAYSMYEKMNECKELFTKFGGHKLAAGLSLPKENLERFRAFVNEHANLKEEDFINKIYIDVAMPLSYVSEKLIKELALLEPFGDGNEKPVFAIKDIRLLSYKILGKQNNVVKITAMDVENKRYSVINYMDGNEWEEFIRSEYGEQQLMKLKEGSTNSVRGDMLYYPEIYEYRNMKTIQFVMLGFHKNKE